MKMLLPLILLLALAWPAAASQPEEEPVAAGSSGPSLPPHSAPSSISWSHVQAEIAKTICVRSSQVEGREYLAPIAGFRKECGDKDAATSIARAVDRAFEEAGILIGSLKPADLNEALKPGLSSEERNRIARHAWLSSEPFLRALLPRLRKALDANGVSCLDCPVPPRQEWRTVSWEQLRPYVAAHIWPDPVRTRPTDPPGKSEYSFHISRSGPSS